MFRFCVEAGAHVAQAGLPLASPSLEQEFHPTQTTVTSKYADLLEFGNLNRRSHRHQN